MIDLSVSEPRNWNIRFRTSRDSESSRNCCDMASVVITNLLEIVGIDGGRMASCFILPTGTHLRHCVVTDGENIYDFASDQLYLPCPLICSIEEALELGYEFDCDEAYCWDGIDEEWVGSIVPLMWDEMKSGNEVVVYAHNKKEG